MQTFANVHALYTNPEKWPQLTFDGQKYSKKGPTTTMWNAFDVWSRFSNFSRRSRQTPSGQFAFYSQTFCTSEWNTHLFIFMFCLFVLFMLQS